MEDIKNQEVQDKETNTEVVETKEQSTETKEPTRNELMRELSKEYGMNLFDAEGLKEFKEYQESKKTETEKLQEQLTSYEEQINSYKEKEFNWQAQLTAQKLNVNEESLEDVLMLAKSKMNDDTSIQDAISQVIEKYPHFTNVQTSEKEKTKFGISYKEDKGNTKPNNDVMDYITKKYKSYNQ